MNHYFSFGQGHTILNKFPLHDYWVRVVASDAGTARQAFIEEFTSRYMEAPDKFAFQYTDNDWNPKHFPKGELHCIIAMDQWWGYIHADDLQLKIKFFYDTLDMDEARKSPFVQQVLGPVFANGREDAAIKLASLLYKS